MSLECPEHDHTNGMEYPNWRTKGLDVLYHLPRMVWTIVSLGNWIIKQPVGKDIKLWFMYTYIYINYIISMNIHIYIYIHIYMCFSNVFTCFYWHMLVIHGYSMIPPGEAKQLSSSPSRRCAATPCDIFGASLHTADSEKSCDLHDISSGWWYTYPSEKYESQLGWLFPIYGKIKNAPNHQPVIVTIVVYSHNSSHYIVL